VALMTAVALNDSNPGEAQKQESIYLDACRHFIVTFTCTPHCLSLTPVFPPSDVFLSFDYPWCLACLGPSPDRVFWLSQRDPLCQDSYHCVLRPMHQLIEKQLTAIGTRIFSKLWTCWLSYLWKMSWASFSSRDFQTNVYPR
jgi:hypothetical protein